MRISVVQMNPGAEKAANVAQAESLIGAALDADRPDHCASPHWGPCRGGPRSQTFRSA